MGTASTMACITEALGISPLGSACPPANGSQRLRVAETAGRLAAQGIPRPSEMLSRKSFENAITVLQAIGGSTNAVVHLLAIAGRVEGLDLTLDDFDAIGRRTPLLVDLKPSGANYMEDFYRAGGVPTLLHELRPLLHLDARTVTGRSLGEELDTYPPPFMQSIVRPFADPIVAAASLVVLRGNLAPDGAVLKQSAMSAHLKKHRGRAVVFKDADDMLARIDDPDLPVDSTSM
jgi:dihydroxy-acid dehydratase